MFQNTYKNLQAFTFDVWLTILGLLIFIPPILTMMRRYTIFHSPFDLITLDYLHVWGIICAESMPGNN